MLIGEEKVWRFPYQIGEFKFLFANLSKLSQIAVDGVMELDYFYTRSDEDMEDTII